MTSWNPPPRTRMGPALGRRLGIPLTEKEIVEKFRPRFLLHISTFILTASVFMYYLFSQNVVACFWIVAIYAVLRLLVWKCPQCGHQPAMFRFRPTNCRHCDSRLFHGEA